MTHPSEIDLEPKQSGGVSDEAVSVLMQVQFWHEKRKDELQSILNNKVDVIKINDIEIDDPEVIRGIRIGIRLSLNHLGDLPFKLSQNEEE